MGFRNKFTFALAIMFGLGVHCSYATRGTYGMRRTTRWKGAAKSSAPKDRERTRKSRDDETSEDDVGDLHEEIPTIEEQEASINESTEKKHGKSKDPKSKKQGEKTKNKDVSLIDVECDDPSDPRCVGCDDISNPLCNGDTATTTTMIPGNLTTANSDHAITTSLPDLAPTVQRVIPPFKISYAFATELGGNDIDDGDYAELAETTELYLTVYFTEYFEMEPADFHEVNVIVQQTHDPLTIRFFVSASFVVPGDVPTMQTMFDRLTNSFSGVRARNYALLLNDLGSENPFRNVRSIALVNESPVETTEEGDFIFNGQTKVRKQRFFAAVFTGIVLLSLFALLVWRRRINGVQQHRRLQLEDVERQDVKATGYLDSIRRQYRDDDESNTEIFNGEEEEDDSMTHCKEEEEDAMTHATDNRHTLTELREAMSALESVVSHAATSSEPLYPKALSHDESESHRKNAEYMNYLDLQASFDEEDLRT